MLPVIRQQKDGMHGSACSVLSSSPFSFSELRPPGEFYQDFFVNSGALGPVTNANLAWVGALQAVGVSLFGFAAGRLAEHIGYRPTGIIGSILLALGLLFASFSTRIWQLYLSLGLLFSIGSAFAFIPALSIPSQWFVKRRGLASGIAVSGYGVGGLVLSPVTRKLIDALGYRWALRTMAILCASLATLAFSFMKSKREMTSRRNEPSSQPQPSPNQNVVSRWHIFKDKSFYALWMFMFLSAFGYYIPTFYTPEYAGTKLHASPADGAAALALQAGMSALGRILLGLLGDYIGHVNALSLCQLFAGIAHMAGWPFVHNFSGLMAFSAAYGFFSGGIVSIPPVVMAEIYGTDRLASIMGIILSGNIPGTLAGPTIAGAIIDANKSADGVVDFLPVQLYGGSWLLGGALATYLVGMLYKLDKRRRGPNAATQGDTSDGVEDPGSQVERQEKQQP